MGKKLVLPLLDVLSEVKQGKGDDRQKPTLEGARQRLGGRPADGPPFSDKRPGCIVLCGDGPGAIVYASDIEVHVLIDATPRGGRMRRVTVKDVTAFTGEVPEGLASVADDARVFAMLAENQHIRYADEAGTLRAAKLVEKCRYGALVARDDGTIVAVGFRKLWPAQRGDAS